VRINSLTGLAITKLDVLSGLESLKICTAYRYNGKQLTEFPSVLKQLQDCEPIYETLPGWPDDVTAVQDENDLPKNARNYIRRLEALVNTPVHIISVGPGRQQTIVLQDPFKR